MKSVLQNCFLKIVTAGSKISRNHPRIKEWLTMAKPQWHSYLLNRIQNLYIQISIHMMCQKRVIIDRAQSKTHLIIGQLVKAKKQTTLVGVSFAIEQVCIPSLEPILTSCLLWICCFYNSTTHDYDITTSIRNDLKQPFMSFSLMSFSRGINKFMRK